MLDVLIDIVYAIIMVLGGGLLVYLIVDSIRVKKGKKSYLFKDEDEE